MNRNCLKPFKRNKKNVIILKTIRPNLKKNKFIQFADRNNLSQAKSLSNYSVKKKSEVAKKKRDAISSKYHANTAEEKARFLGGLREKRAIDSKREASETNCEG